MSAGGADGGPASFVVPMMPPNLTGDLHVGHALMIAVQDALVRSALLDGRRAVYVPGFDHAGTGMYSLVARATEFRPGLPMGERLRHWAAEHRAALREQMRSLNPACDWDRELYTLDPAYQDAVSASFGRMAEAGLLYRDRRVVPWCFACGTTIPDIEREVAVEVKRRALVSVRSGRRQVIVETDAELLWGVVGVLVPATGPLARASTVEVPCLGRSLPVLTHARTTVVQLVTPAADEDHRRLAEAARLPTLPLFDRAGRSVVRELPGLDRMALRAETVHRLNLPEVSRRTAVTRCGRCGDELIGQRSWQWYLRMAPLAKRVEQGLADGEFRIGPDPVRREAVHWLRGIRDWCISRQIPWGQPIPAWVCPNCPAWSRLPGSCADCQQPLVREADVFDTWFNSSHVTLAAAGWPDAPDVTEGYPATITTSGRDIVFFQFVRMLAIGYLLTGRPPSRECWLHGLVRDERGEKMSKSRGNAVRVPDVVREYGADVLRAALLAACRGADDVRFDRRLVRRYARVAALAVELAELGGAGNAGARPGESSPPDDGYAVDSLEHWCRSLAQRTRDLMREALARRDFAAAAKAAGDFAWGPLSRYTAVRRRHGGRSSADLLADVAAVLEPLMPVAAALVRPAAHPRGWVVDVARAERADRFLRAVREAERLRGAIGITVRDPVIVHAADGMLTLLADEPWTSVVSLLAVRLDVPPVGGVAVPVLDDASPGAEPLRIHLDARFSDRLTAECRRRLSSVGAARRRILRRLRWAEAGVAGHDRGADPAERSRQARQRLMASLTDIDRTADLLAELPAPVGAHLAAAASVSVSRGHA